MKSLEPKLVERTYSTLSEIFRLLASALTKPESEETLKETWNYLKPYLKPGVNKRYVRRCVADAWVGIVRKARGDGLKKLIDIMLEGDQSGLEAVWSHSLKGAKDQLHSRGQAILEILMDHLKRNPTDQETETMEMILTSLCHHCSSTALGPVIQAILDRISNVSSSDSQQTSAGVQLEQSAAIIHLLCTTLLVRKGKKVPENMLKPIMLSASDMLDAELRSGSLGYPQRWSNEILKLFVGVFMASRLEQWLSPGVSLMEKIWKNLVSTDIEITKECVADHCSRLSDVLASRNR